ncbi:uncharacterized protein LOC121188921 [Toxotes jaculatrix]|uniref:uncharacterized protein LOC121188921 n=1 Tax=Toxotes jaculatrix TaxID=941984 RepID=UPI001B3AD9B1|nr:uncharacterized protein LOC121188921 [Toxotes jaculatrix]
MGILTQLLWSTTEWFLETPPPPPRVSPTPTLPLRRFPPKLVVLHCLLTPSSGGSLSQVSGQASVAQQQKEESFLPLNPKWFGGMALRAMEEVSPSHLCGVVDCRSPPARKKVASSAAARRRRTRERRPHSRQSPVNNLVGLPPTRVSRGLEDDAPSSPVPLVRRSRTTDGQPPTQTPHTQTSVTNTVRTPFPSSTSWPWIVDDGLTTS